MSDIPRDAETREEIIDSQHDNYVVSASAGSGKTTILVKKAFSLINNRQVKPYQNIALITFTRLATKQLEEKIKETISENAQQQESDFYIKKFNVSTTEAFVISEIIKPFLREAYGRSYPRADEIVHDYSKRFGTLEEGLERLRSASTLGSYNYAKKNFNYELALCILKKSNNARLYLKAKYPYIMVDEYQDVDHAMHNLYMYFSKELQIKLFLVGDTKQLLYSFRGADKEIFTSLENNEKFMHYTLIENFRSHMSIVKYSYDFIGENIKEEDENRVYFYSEAHFKELLKEGIDSKPQEEWAYLYGRKGIWNRQKSWFEKEEFEIIEDTPLNSGSPNYNVLEPLLNVYFDAPSYNIYSVLEDLQLSITKEIYEKMKEMIKALNDNPDKVLKELEEMKDLKLSDDEKQKFKETLDDQYKVNFNIKAFKKVALTIHKAKGLEFDHVIVHADSFYHSSSFQEENHYVAITRPKQSLHIVMNQRYEELLKKKGIPYDLV